jgi:hypothetical protein
VQNRVMWFRLTPYFVISEGTNSNENSGHINKPSWSNNILLLGHNILQIPHISAYFVPHVEQATGWSTQELGIDFRQRQEIFIFSINFWTAPGPTQALIQWVSGTVSLGKDSRRVQLTIRLPLLLKSSPLVFMACAWLIKTF